MVKVSVPAFFAHGDTSTPVRVGFVAIALNLALNLAFMVPLRHMGPALATSVSALFNVIMLGVLLSRRGQLAIDRRLRSRLARMAAAALAMAVVLIVLERYLFVQVATTPGVRWAALAGLIGSGVRPMPRPGSSCARSTSARCWRSCTGAGGVKAGSTAFDR